MNSTFEPITQSADLAQVNEVVEAVGFDFVRSPKVECEYFIRARSNELVKDAVVKIKTFESKAIVKDSNN